LWPEATTLRQRSSGDLQALHDTILASAGDPYRGKRLFSTACGRCHRLFGEGGDLGPDLTSDPRNDLSRLLGAVAAPSAEIREGFENFVAITSDGRVISGLLVDQDEHVVVLREADGRTVLLRRNDLEELVKQRKSLMPDGLLDRLPDDELRDLFAYLRSSQPLNE
ncbi:MAG: c-type cytochrome, partial [Planctomycetota bacterium]|nr:c-type cytochrome [Planctomycetota bacterium]